MPYAILWYAACMRKRLEALLNRFRTWPAQAQEEAEASLQAIEQDFFEDKDILTEFDSENDHSAVA